MSTEFQLETECINQLAIDGYGLSVNRHVGPQMRSRDTNLVGVRRVLAKGRVIHSDMLENRGLWIVLGDLIDGGLLTVTVAVRSNEHEVEILNVE